MVRGLLSPCGAHQSQARWVRRVGIDRVALTGDHDTACILPAEPGRRRHQPCGL